MVYPLEFIELQLSFAKLLVGKLQINIKETILLYTNIYLMLTLDFSFDQANAIWQEFLADFEPTSEYIYNYYLKTQNNPSRKDTKRSNYFGCYSYHYEDTTNTIRLHFTNNDTSGFGPLSSKRISRREKELTQMFQAIKNSHPNAALVKGKSWLYSLEAYKRLFPQEFISALQIFAEAEWQFMTRWGQFINSEGVVKKDLAQDFLACVKAKASIESCLECFPFKIYVAQAPIKVFYLHYVKVSTLLTKNNVRDHQQKFDIYRRRNRDSK